MRLKVFIIAFLGAMLMALAASAQFIPVDYWELSFYNAGAASPFQGPMRIDLTDASCGQPKQSGTNVNPTRVVWNDPRDPAFDCVAFRTQGQLIGWPITVGNYEATLIAVNSTDSSPESARAPFALAVLGAPGVPENVRIIRVDDETTP